MPLTPAARPSGDIQFGRRTETGMPLLPGTPHGVTGADALNAWDFDQLVADHRRPIPSAADLFTQIASRWNQLGGGEAATESPMPAMCLETGAQVDDLTRLHIARSRGEPTIAIEGKIHATGARIN